MDKIEIYTNNTCPYCKQIKDELNKKNIKFEEKLTPDFTDEYQEIVNLTGIPTVPTIKYNDEYFIPGRDFHNAGQVIEMTKHFQNSKFNIEKQLFKENNTSAAREIAQLNSALNSAATSSDVMINQDLDAEIIQDLQAQMSASSNNLDQSYFIVNNKLVSQREFENLLQDQDFINDVKSGEASYSVIGASQNIKNKIQESEVLSPEKVTEERVEMLEDG